METILKMSPEVLLLVGGVASLLLLTIMAHLLKRGGSSAFSALLLARNIVLPVAALYIYLVHISDLNLSEGIVRSFKTALGVLGIWLMVSLVTDLFFPRRDPDSPKEAVSGLMMDLTRFSLLFVGSVLVITLVWDQSLSHLFATLGVGSVVIGLALQETLGNLFSGIALHFEQPFQIGDWIKVGETIGEVVETNWRSVRLRTRDLTLVAVPNSVLTKERISNFSRPTPIHGIQMYVGFSYDDPPFKAKQALREVLAQTPCVLRSPPPRIRTRDFADSSVTYELRFFINDYAALPEIEEDVRTRIWYAARRYHLTVPYPIRTVYKTEIPRVEGASHREDALKILPTVSLFKGISPDMIEWIANQVIELGFGSGERVVTQGDEGDAFYVITEGRASIKHELQSGEEEELNELTVGGFFGERALFTGEPRLAHVYALTDLQVLAIYRETFQELLRRDSAFADRLADLIESQDEYIRELHAHEGSSLPESPHSRVHLLSRIRDFLRVA